MEQSAATGALAFYVSRSSGDGRPDDAQIDTFMQYAPHLARALVLRRRIRSDLATASQARHQGNATITGIVGLDSRLHVRWLDGEAEQLLKQCDGIRLPAAYLH